MKVSVNTLRFLNDHFHSAGDPAPDGIDDLTRKIGAQLGAIEETIDLGGRFKGVLVVKVVTCEDHPNADRLHVCKVDDGGKAQNVERDENGHVQVVCGAPNVREGLTVAWLPPGATVPDTYGEDPFVLEARELRGVVSNGMLASPKELSLGDSHEGILEIDGDIAPGTPFAEAFNLVDDVVIDMENKMFTHRPDCFGFLGVAREIEGIYNRPYKSPEWYQLNPQIPGVEAEELKLEVRNEVPELVPRFTAITMRNVTIKPSPVWLQVELSKVGIRPINNIVDYTNFFMLETGQPLHAYDYDKVKSLSEADHATIVVRKPQQGEKITLLSGKEVEPREDAIMIATNKQLIGIGGVMGGADTEVDENTKNIIIECANFDMYSIRRTSMAHGLFTDAVTRFNKGQSPLQNLAVLGKIVDEIRLYADGKVASDVIDDNHLPAEVRERGSLFPAVDVSAQFINTRLGLRLSAEEMKAVLENVEFKVEVVEGNLSVLAPFWRTDIEIPEDIVEEVGRLYGFDHLPLELPKRDLTPVEKDSLFELKSRVRAALSKAGANEVLTYSFVHGDLLDKVGQDRNIAFQLSNALSPDLQYFRLSLLPSLLDKVHANVKAGYDEFALFELGKTHATSVSDDDGLPHEFDNLALVYTAAKSQKPGAAYYEAREFLMHVAEKLGVGVELVAFSDRGFPMDASFDPSRSAHVKLQGTDEIVGVVGEFKSSIRKSLKLTEKSAGFELGVGRLLGEQSMATKYATLPRFPKIEQDVCLKVAVGTSYGELFSFVNDELSKTKPERTTMSLSPVDIYQRDDDKGHKQLTLRLSIASFEKTMRDEEVSKLLDNVAVAAKEKFGAERV